MRAPDQQVSDTRGKKSRDIGGLALQAIRLALHHVVALTTTCFETGPIDDSYVTAAIMNDRRPLQLAHRIGHAVAPHSQ